MELAMVNDWVGPLAEAKISAHDRSIYFGDGIYEVFRSYGGKLFAMDRHMQRLERSLREMDMLAKVSLPEVEGRVRRLLAESGMAETIIYLQITRGADVPRLHDYIEDWHPGYLLTVRNKPPKSSDTVTCITHADLRWKRCDIKSLNLLPNVMARHKATAVGSYEAILIDDQGLVTEGTAASVLMIKKDVLRTAPLTANILPGITRALLIEWAGKVGLGVREESFTLAEMMAADELMVTGTGTEVMGVTHVDGQIIGKGGCGAFTKKYQSLLAEITRAL